MTHLYLQEIFLDEEARADLKAIPSQEEAGQREIKEKTKLFFKNLKEKLKNQYPFLNLDLFDIVLNQRRDTVYVVFYESRSDNKRAIKELFNLNFDNNKDFREYCKKEFEKKFEKELEEIPELKKKINDLEKKLKFYEKDFDYTDFDYTKITYRNLNDLNSAKFLSDDEKRLICGLLPKSK